MIRNEDKFYKTGLEFEQNWKQMNRQLKLELNSSICILLNSLETFFFLFCFFLFQVFFFFFFFLFFFFFFGWCSLFCRLSSCYQYLGRFFLFLCPCCGVGGDPFRGGDTYLMDTNRSLGRRGRHPSVSGSGNPSVATNTPFSSLQIPLAACPPIYPQ